MGYSRGIDDRLRRFFGWSAADRFSCPHDAPDRALLAVAVLVLLIAVFAPAARERGAEPAKAKDEALTHNEAHTGRDIPSRAQQAQVAPTTVVDI